MPRIAVMSPALASQIAAGEVVERPSSVVKELVENAIDAGASRVDVEIEGGGITRIVVSDDGRGMESEDAVLAVERYATSKLFAFDELARIGTYGFRGEALPSIASVSRLSIRTRAREAEAGISVEVSGGAEPVVKPTGAPVGTTVEVRDLFFNVVPRRKFLRSAGTEAGHVTDVVEAAALSRPDITFSISRDGRRVREWLRVDTRQERVRTLVGDGLAECRGERGPLRLEAHLSRPEHARSGAGGLRLLVNGRPVRDRALLHTIAQAYGSVLERGRYPRGVVYLDVATSLVDVNVHPQKAEVRFADPRAVTDAVYVILAAELARAFSLPSPSRSPWVARAAASVPSPSLTTAANAAVVSPDSGETREGAWNAEDLSAIHDDQPSAVASGALTDQSNGFRGEQDASAALALSDSGVAGPAAPSRWASLRFVAQVRQTYLICEGQEGLFVLDQHAAAERVNFDRLRKQHRSRAVPSQALLFPLTIQIEPEECEVVEQRAKELAALGMDIRVRGTKAVSVHSVPKLLTRASPERLVRDLLSEVSRTGRRAFSDAIDLALATMACHGSIRAGDALSESEASALLVALDTVDFAGHCPHGRPVVAVTSWAELERKVGRR